MPGVPWSLQILIVQIWIQPLTFLQNYYIYSSLPGLHIALGIYQVYSYEYQKPNNQPKFLSFLVTLIWFFYQVL